MTDGEATERPSTIPVGMSFHMRGLDEEFSRTLADLAEGGQDPDAIAERGDMPGVAQQVLAVKGL